MWTPKLGDWIRPTDSTINQINHGFNLRLIIEVPTGYKDGDTFKTVCEAFGEEYLWDVYNSEFIARLILE